MNDEANGGGNFAKERSLPVQGSDISAHSSNIAITVNDVSEEDEGHSTERNPPRTRESSEAPSFSGQQRLAVWKTTDLGGSFSRPVSPMRTYDFTEDNEDVRSEASYGTKRRGVRSARGRKPQAGTPISSAEKRRLAATRNVRPTRRRGREASEAPEDAYEFHGTPPEYDAEDGQSEHSEVSAYSKRLRGSYAPEDSESTEAAMKRFKFDEDADGDEDFEDDTESTKSGTILSSKKVPPLRISLTKNPSEEEEKPAEVPPPRAKGAPRGRPANRKNNDTDDAQRITRSKVKQNFKEDLETGKRKKNRAQQQPPVVKEEPNDTYEEEINAETKLRLGMKPEIVAPPADLTEAERLIYEPPLAAALKTRNMLKKRWLQDYEQDEKNWEADKGLFANTAIYKGDYDIPEVDMDAAIPLQISNSENSTLISLYESQRTERQELKQVFLERLKRMELTLEEEYIKNERRRLGHAPKLSMMRILREQQSCNPLTLGEEPTAAPVVANEELAKRFRACIKQQRRLMEMEAECLYEKQLQEFREKIDDTKTNERSIDLGNVVIQVIVAKMPVSFLPDLMALRTEACK